MCTACYSVDAVDLERQALRSHLLRMIGELNGAGIGDVLGESERFQVEHARDCLATWDLAREGNPGIDRERVLADQLRTVLAIVDELAPKEADR